MEVEQISDSQIVIKTLNKDQVTLDLYRGHLLLSCSDNWESYTEVPLEVEEAQELGKWLIDWADRVRKSLGKWYQCGCGWAQINMLGGPKAWGCPPGACNIS